MSSALLCLSTGRSSDCNTFIVGSARETLPDAVQAALIKLVDDLMLGKQGAVLRLMTASGQGASERGKENLQPRPLQHHHQPHQPAKQQQQQQQLLPLMPQGPEQQQQQQQLPPMLQGPEQQQQQQHGSNIPQDPFRHGGSYYSSRIQYSQVWGINVKKHPAARTRNVNWGGQTMPTLPGSDKTTIPPKRRGRPPGSKNIKMGKKDGWAALEAVAATAVKDNKREEISAVYEDMKNFVIDKKKKSSSKMFSKVHNLVQDYLVCKGP